MIYIQKLDLYPKTLSVSKNAIHIQKRDLYSKTRSISKDAIYIQKHDLYPKTRSISKDAIYIQRRDLYPKRRDLYQKEAIYIKKHAIYIKHTRSIYKDAINIKNRFDPQGANRYFLFLDTEGIEPTNNRTEQAIRFVVLDRRVTQGTRSDAGMRFCERAWTAVATCARHQQSVYQFFLDAITATLNPNRPYPAIIPEKV